MLKQLLEKLLCKHRWKLYAAVEWSYTWQNTASHRRETLICKNCGKIKNIEI